MLVSFSLVFLVYQFALRVLNLHVSSLFESGLNRKKSALYNNLLDQLQACLVRINSSAAEWLHSLSRRADAEIGLAGHAKFKPASRVIVAGLVQHIGGSVGAPRLARLNGSPIPRRWDTVHTCCSP